ncbi:MAG: DUF4397 domain-containing protein [Candidatus Eremiobacteraeota bacterium]|nr:DUF4397 domain-containing protein [Candidatus Eremiobacteraeota bacterium]
MNRFRITAGLLVVAVSLVLAACNGSGSTTQGVSGNANIRYINGSPDAGPIDVYVNGTVVVEALA